MEEFDCGCKILDGTDMEGHCEECAKSQPTDFLMDWDTIDKDLRHHDFGDGFVVSMDEMGVDVAWIEPKNRKGLLGARPSLYHAMLEPDGKAVLFKTVKDVTETVETSDGYSISDPKPFVSWAIAEINKQLV